MLLVFPRCSDVADTMIQVFLRIQVLRDLMCLYTAWH